MSLQFKSEREARAFFAQIKRPFPGDAARAAGVAAVEAALAEPTVSFDWLADHYDRTEPKPVNAARQARAHRFGLLAVQAALMEGV